MVPRVVQKALRSELWRQRPLGLAVPSSLVTRFLHRQTLPLAPLGSDSQQAEMTPVSSHRLPRPFVTPQLRSAPTSSPEIPASTDHPSALDRAWTWCTRGAPTSGSVPFSRPWEQHSYRQSLVSFVGTTGTPPPVHSSASWPKHQFVHQDHGGTPSSHIWQEASRGVQRLFSSAQLSGSQALQQAEASPNPKEADAEVQLTQRCVERLHELEKEEGKAVLLRLSVEGGGCSGFQYVFGLEHELKEGDRVFERDGAKVVMDDVTLSFVSGAQVDFSEELIRSAFQVVKNPHSASSCGCGSSFVAK